MAAGCDAIFVEMHASSEPRTAQGLASKGTQQSVAALLWLGFSFAIFGMSPLAYAGEVTLPNDGELVYESDRIVVGTLAGVQAKRDPANRFLGTLIVTEWLQGGPLDPASNKLTLVLEDRTSREELEKTPPDAPQLASVPIPIIPIGEAQIFFLHQTTLSGVHELTHSYVGFWPLQQRDRLLKAMEIASRPKDFLDAPDSHIRISAAFVLGRRSVGGDWPFLLKLLRDENREVPFTLIRALDLSPLSFFDIRSLEGECFENPDKNVGGWLLRKLCYTSNLSFQAFLKALQDDDNSMRSQATSYNYPLPRDSVNGYEEIISALIGAMRNPKSSDGFGPVIDMSDTLYRMTGQHPEMVKVNSDGSRSYYPEIREAEVVEFWEAWWREKEGHL